MISERDLSPPAGARSSCKKGLDWFKAGHGGNGLKDQTVDEARSIARGDKQKIEKVRRMRAWFARHAVDKQSDSWKEGTDDNPSPSQVAWELWGGDAGRSWSNEVMARLERG